MAHWWYPPNGPIEVLHERWPSWDVRVKLIISVRRGLPRKPFFLSCRPSWKQADCRNQLAVTFFVWLLRPPLQEKSVSPVPGPLSRLGGQFSREIGETGPRSSVEAGWAVSLQGWGCRSRCVGDTLNPYVACNKSKKSTSLFCFKVCFFVLLNTEKFATCFVKNGKSRLLVLLITKMSASCFVQTENVSLLFC